MGAVVQYNEDYVGEYWDGEPFLYHDLFYADLLEDLWRPIRKTYFGQRSACEQLGIVRGSSEPTGWTHTF